MDLSRAIASASSALLAAALCSACVQHPDWEPGAFYSVTGGDGAFAVVKVLALDSGVGVRLYREKFPARPPAVDPAGLSLGQVGDTEGFGIGHLPLAERDFVHWFPVFIQRGTVAEDELDGYRMWKDAGALAFGSSRGETRDGN